MKLPKLSFTATLKIPVRLIAAIFTIPLTIMFGGALLILFAPESSISQMLSSLDERVAYEAATQAITTFVYKYNIIFMQNEYLCDPAILAIIIGIICYIVSGGLKESFHLYVNVCKWVFNLPLKDLTRYSFLNVGLIVALTLDLFVAVYGLAMLLAFAFPASLFAAIRGIYLDFGAKADITI